MTKPLFLVLALVAGGCGSKPAPAPSPVPPAVATAACPDVGTNLVPNGGFDQGVGGWAAGEPGEDASGCVSSKSLLLTATKVDDSSLLVATSTSPCFALPALKTSFGATMKRIEGAAVGCFVLVWTDSASCEQKLENGRRLDLVDNGLASPGQWDRQKADLPAQPAGAFARVLCRSDGKGAVDEVFLRPAP